MSRDYQTPIVNDANQVVSARLLESGTSFAYQIIRRDPDGSEVVLALWDLVNPSNGTVGGFDRFSMNNLGEVAAEIITLTGERQIVKFAADGFG